LVLILRDVPLIVLSLTWRDLGSGMSIRMGHDGE
jgi:hypothetical protein